MHDYVRAGREFLEEFKACKEALHKAGFVQTADPNQPPPMDPSQMPPGGPPMDPSQMPPGAMPPGAPPMDPSQMPPGAMPPQGGPAMPEMEAVMQDVTAALGTIQQDRDAMKAEQQTLGEAQLTVSQQVSDLMQQRAADQETIKGLVAEIENVKQLLTGPAVPKPSAE